MANYYIIIDQDSTENICGQLILDNLKFSCEPQAKVGYNLSVYCNKGIDILENAGYTVFVG